MVAKLNEVKATLHQLKPELILKYPIASMRLFGSIVRDDFTGNSDIDIIVDFNGRIGIEFIDLQRSLKKSLIGKWLSCQERELKKNICN